VGPPPPPGPLLLPAWVLPGGVSLCTPGFSARFVADFDRTQTLDLTTAEAAVRVIRPGVIVLANLDIDDVASLPAPLPADLTIHLDAKDAKTNGATDEQGMTKLDVTSPDLCVVSAKKVTIQIDGGDVERLRIFEKGKPDPILGKGATAPTPTAHDIPAPPLPTVFKEYLIEALTLPGDVSHPGPSGATPEPPDAFPATLPSGVAAGSPIHARRAPGEVWLELHHDVDPPFRPVRDVALVTIAPWIITPNTLPAERLYAVYFRPSSAGVDSNQAFVFELAEAVKAAMPGAVSMPVDTGSDFTPHGHGSTEPFFIIDGDTFLDQWVQDELEFGYCWAPHAWMHVVLHLKRDRPLQGWVRAQLAESGVGVFEGIDPKNPGPDAVASINYGGNLEVSPAVPSATAAMPRDGGGPTVPAHPAAPLGKIILGDCTPRPAHDDFRKFLLAQKVQPILPVDTSWLMVGHVDEFASFIPSTRSARGFKLVMASVRAMDKLIDALIAVSVASGRGHFHAGRFEAPPGGFARTEYAEESAEDMRATFGTYNTQLRSRKLIPLQQRLEKGLAIAPSEIIPLPNYFKVPTDPTAPFGTPDHQTVAHNVGSVNMQIIQRHLLVPRPFGPRMPSALARSVARKVLDGLGLASVPLKTGPVGGFDYWAEPGMNLNTIAAFFTVPTSVAMRQEIRANIRSGTPMSATTTTVVAALETAIRTEPTNQSGTDPLSLVAPAGTLSKWKRLRIPQDTLDVVEVYIRSVLEHEGNTVHFIDNWNTYHIQLGEVHCGTNVRRTPHAMSSPERWWDHYDPDLDWSYDPAS